MGVPILDAPLARGDVALDLFRPEDVSDAYVGWLNDPVVVRYTEARFEKHTATGARDYVIASNSGEGSRLFRILAAGRHVGNLRVSAISRQHGRAEIAIILGDRSVHGRGIGSTAVDLAAGWCFAAAGMRKLCAGMYASNEPSIRAFARAGFAPEARLAAHVLSDGIPMDIVLMARFAPQAGRSPS